MIDQYLSHEESIVREAAEKISRLEGMKNRGEITQVEFEKLCQSVLSTKSVILNMDDMTRRQNIMEALQQVAMAVGIIFKSL